MHIYVLASYCSEKLHKRLRIANMPFYVAVQDVKFDVLPRLTTFSEFDRPVLRLIHTCHAAPLPFSDSAVSFVKVRVVAGNIRTASPTV
jgi:hypothetical protein